MISENWLHDYLACVTARQADTERGEKGVCDCVPVTDISNEATEKERGRVCVIVSL